MWNSRVIQVALSNFLLKHQISDMGMGCQISVESVHSFLIQNIKFFDFSIEYQIIIDFLKYVQKLNSFQRLSKKENKSAVMLVIVYLYSRQPGD